MTKAKVWGGKRTQLVAQDDLSAALGRLFRSVREERGVTLQALSDAIERRMNVIRFHEAGVRLMRADDLTRAALAMGVAPRSLMLPHGDASEVEGDTDGRSS